MITNFIKSIFLISILSLIGCASSQKSKDYEYMSSQEYQKKPNLTQSLLNANEPLSEDAVQKILSSKITFPKKINIAIVKLSDSYEGIDYQTISQEVSEKLYDKSNWGEKVQSIIPMPQVMIAKPITLTSLRQAAVLLQADALLIIKPASYGDWKFQWFDSEKAKGITSLEVLLLDTRTNVVPFTSVVTETAEITKDNTDYNNYELMNRAKLVSETKALLQVAPLVQKFISRVL